MRDGAGECEWWDCNRMGSLWVQNRFNELVRLNTVSLGWHWPVPLAVNDRARQSAHRQLNLHGEQASARSETSLPHSELLDHRYCCALADPRLMVPCSLCPAPGTSYLTVTNYRASAWEGVNGLAAGGILGILVVHSASNWTTCRNRARQL